jgi:hypothetical protein
MLRRRITPSPALRPSGIDTDRANALGWNDIHVRCERRQTAGLRIATSQKIHDSASSTQDREARMVGRISRGAGAIVAAVLFAAVNVAQAQVLTFEPLQDLEGVEAYYNGGFGSMGTGPGPDHGVIFENALAVKSLETGGSGNFTNAPSGNTILFFLSGTASTMNVDAGFITGFSFFYSSITQAGEVRVWSGLNATGVLLAALNLTALGGCAFPTAYCNWAPIGVLFDGTARSVEFGGVANFIAFDDITLGRADPGDPSVIPEPMTMVLLATGLAGIAVARRRRRTDTDSR